MPLYRSRESHRPPPEVVGTCDLELELKMLKLLIQGLWSVTLSRCLQSPRTTVTRLSGRSQGQDEVSRCKTAGSPTAALLLTLTRPRFRSEWSTVSKQGASPASAATTRATYPPTCLPQISTAPLCLL